MTEEKNTKQEQKKERAIEFLQSAILQCQKSGITVTHGNYGNSFVVIVAGYNQESGSIAPCKE